MRSIVVLLGVAAAIAAGCSKPTELASNENAKGELQAAAAPPGTTLEPPPPDPAAPLDAASAFPDYTPKTTADTVTDYRASVAGDINALPSLNDPTALAQAFVDWKAKAAASPGANEQGQVQLGADPQEYRPSDAELVAAEAGDRLAAVLQGADETTKSAVAAILGASPEARVYRRFDFRHSDVMGSGRFFYASAPKEAALPN